MLSGIYPTFEHNLNYLFIKHSDIYHNSYYLELDCF